MYYFVFFTLDNESYLLQSIYSDYGEAKKFYDKMPDFLTIRKRDKWKKFCLPSFKETSSI